MPEKSLQFIFINGKGSSGKDTQADLILARYPEKAIRISTGDIYREAKISHGEFAKYHDLIEPYIAVVDSGGYLPDELIVGIVKEVILEQTLTGKEMFIFTGFPRTEGQLTLVDGMLSGLSEDYKIAQHYIYYFLSDELSRKRAENRRQVAQKEGKAIRPDDEPAVIERRLKTFKELTQPMLERLEHEGRLIEIDASGTIESIGIETSARISKERN